MLPPLSAIGNCRIELFGPPAVEVTFWDQAKWDEDVWGGAGWQDVTPQALNVQISWGTDDNMGALSVSAAGSWQIYTYDPQRILDPANYNSPYAGVLKPGGIIRIKYSDGVRETVARAGFIDEISFDLMEKTGSIRASDGISMLAKAKTPAGMAHDPGTPITLRAFARYVLAKASVTYIKVEADPPAPDYDPAIGLAINEEASAWQQISAAALDALYAVWLDSDGILRFRYFGKPFDTGIKIGTDGIPIDNLTTKLSLEGVFNHAAARYMSFDEVYHTSIKQTSVDTFGDLLLTRDRPIPRSQEWVDQILQDRGAGAPQYEIGTLRPRTPQELQDILSLGMADMVGIHARHGTPIDRNVVVLGGTVEANTESGWSATLVTYESALPWYPYDANRLYQRRYNATDSLQCTSTWQSTQTVLTASRPVNQEAYDDKNEQVNGAIWSKSVNIEFQSIDFTDMGEIWDAKLRLYLPVHEDAPPPPGEPNIGHSRWLKFIAAQLWDESVTDCGFLIGWDESISYAEVGGQGEWIEFDIRSTVELWRGGAAQYGVYIGSEPDNPDYPEHALIAGALSGSTVPYLLITFKR